MSRSRWAIVVGLAMCCIVFGVVAWSIVPILSRDLSKPVASTKVLARDGSLLYEVSGESDGSRTPVPLSRVPSSTIQVILSTEDDRFYQHHGVDWLAIGRVFRDLISHQKVMSGASTIEQQLLKMLYFPDRPRTIVQKCRELIAARYWSLTHTKEQTLELYLNTIYFGNQAYGIQAAARTYFHTDVQSLNLAESSLLAGVIASPNAYDPYAHPKASRSRQKSVIDQLVAHGDIDADAGRQAAEDEIPIFPPSHRLRAPHFVFRVLAELETRYPAIRSGGYLITTTLDPDLQRVVEDTVARRLAKIVDQHVTDGAAVVLDPRTGEILAYVGSADYFSPRIQGQVDMATALRQPGSALKPFVYLTAFMRDMSPSTVVADLPIRFETATGQGYYPKNYSNKYHGPVSLRDALGSSLNIPAVKVLDRVGLPALFSVLNQFGIRFPETPEYYGLGVVLGGGEVTLMDTLQAYANLARSVHTIPVRDVLRIQDASGSVIEEMERSASKPLFEDQKKGEQAAYLVSDVLSDPSARVKAFGEANFLGFGKRIAVKTGTTRDFRDNWAFGYTPEVAVGVWVGNADNTPMKGVSGVSGAAPIWADIMRYVTRSTDQISWTVPPGIVQRSVCVTSGLGASSICPKTRNEIFIAGTEPTKIDDWYERCEATGKVYLKPPGEYSAWMTSMKFEQVDGGGCTSVSSTAPVILLPLDGDVYEKSDVVADASQGISFVAGGEKRRTYRWYLNDQMFERSGPSFAWNPVPGEYQLRLEGAVRAIHFSVR
ncbi:penicillin-binding protein 1C [Patescibacteria group bacterium]|nr:penicillin-binding protein 1C [Patescibacteria group bacterium]